jgi:hypothetical protein
MIKILDYLKLEIIKLYRNDLNSSYHIRQMAQLIKTSHVALIPHLKELEKSDILHSYKNKMNKSYKLNLKNVLVKDIISISEKINTIQIMNNDKNIDSLYRFFNDLNGCMMMFDYTKDIDSDTINLLYLGDMNDIKSKDINELKNRLNKKINILSGNIKQFELQFNKRTELIDKILNDHIILTNPDMFVRLIYKNSIK